VRVNASPQDRVMRIIVSRTDAEHAGHRDDCEAQSDQRLAENAEDPPQSEFKQKGGENRSEKTAGFRSKWPIEVGIAQLSRWLGYDGAVRELSP